MRRNQKYGVSFRTDPGFPAEPVDISKYEFARMPHKEQWGILTRRDSELALKKYIRPEDLADVPLLMVKRELVKNELSSWFGEYYDRLHISATYNLIINAAAMVRGGVGTALCFDLGIKYHDDLCFVPLMPVLETGSVLVWKKNQAMSKISKSEWRDQNESVCNRSGIYGTF